jgi:homoserine O-succinyltransferase
MPLKVEKPGAITREPRVLPAARTASAGLVIGLINNMPDAALEATESQFSTLLAAAAGQREVRLRLSYLPEVKRGPEAQRYLHESYWPLAALQADPPDALIVTGAEPLAPLLSQEPYWERFIAVVEWADANTISSVWSCLAAHAAVQHLDGVRRQRRTEKLCGVYHHTVLEGHPLNAGLIAPLLTPQSRWNDLPVGELRDAGYAIASESAATGANVFTKYRRSLMVFLQGHPEYESCTLLREYRRDIARFLAGTNSQYPALPQGYLSDAASDRMAAYQELATAQRSPQSIVQFPFEAEARELRHSWKASSIILYANWLSFIAQTLEAARKHAPQRDAIVTE